MADINIFMTGGRRTGKTTILASIADQMAVAIQGTNLLFTTVDGITTHKLQECIGKLNDYFQENNKDVLFVAEEGQTTEADIYSFNLKVAGCANNLTVDFIDVPGEWFNNPNHDDEIQKYIEMSQVFVIAADSPALMENPNPNGIGRNHADYNQPKVITNYFQNYITNKNNTLTDRMFLFVPVKCEKYYLKTYDAIENPQKKDYMAELNKNVKLGYADLISFLKCDALKDNCVVAIMPIISIGGVRFHSFAPDKNIYGEKFYVISGGEYKPKYCEQPLIYTLSFLVKKLQTNNPEVHTAPTGFFERLFNAIFKIFGGDKELETKVTGLSEKMKKSGDGYEILQNPLNI